MGTPRALLCSSVLATSVAVATSALAADAPPESPPSSTLFGQRGHVAFDDVLGVRIAPSPVVAAGSFSAAVVSTGVLAYSTMTQTGAPNDSQMTMITFAPSVDYFVTDQITLGGDLGIGYQRVRFSSLASGSTPASGPVVTSGYLLSIRPRVGYVARLSEDLYLWPRVGLGYGMTHIGGDLGMLDGHSFSAEADLGVVVLLTRHAYINVGPTLGYVANSADTVPAGTAATSAGGIVGGARGALGLVF